MASPFRESIVKLLDSIEGGVACVLMGFDGITRRHLFEARDAGRRGRSGHPDPLDGVRPPHRAGAPDAGLGRRRDAGGVHPRTDKLTLVVRLLTPEYFLACAILPAASLGRARYLMRLTAPGLRADL